MRQARRGSDILLNTTHQPSLYLAMLNIKAMQYCCERREIARRRTEEE